MGDGAKLDGGAINRVADLARQAQEIQQVELEDGRILTDKSLTPIYEPEADVWVGQLRVSSLTSVVDYLAENPDKLELENVLVVVDDHWHVSVMSGVRGPARKRTRHKYLEAIAELPDPHELTGGWTGLERAQILLRTRCQETEELNDLVRLLGNITAHQLEKAEDDGFTQEVSTKAGVSLVKEELERVPNPILLRPIRSFPELEEQVASPFLVRLRLREGARLDGGNAVQVMFQETDGGAWVQATRDAIRAWLEEMFANRVGDVKILA